MDNFLDHVARRKTAIHQGLAELKIAERIYRQSKSDALLPVRPYIKDGIIRLLGEVYPMGLTALEILDRINRRWWQGALKRTSLSPQITLLKKAGKIVKDRGTWKAIRQENGEE